MLLVLVIPILRLKKFSWKNLAGTITLFRAGVLIGLIAWWVLVGSLRIKWGDLYVEFDHYSGYFLIMLSLACMIAWVIEPIRRSSIDKAKLCVKRTAAFLILLALFLFTGFFTGSSGCGLGEPTNHHFIRVYNLEWKEIAVY